LSSFARSAAEQLPAHAGEQYVIFARVGATIAFLITKDFVVMAVTVVVHNNNFNGKQSYCKRVQAGTNVAVDICSAAV